jgi:hypothetical protein
LMRFMAKVLFLIISGDEKMDLALTMAVNAISKKFYDDLKIVFFGPSEERLLRLQGASKDNFEKLLSSGAIDSSCVNYANNRNIKEELSKLSIKLLPAGERVSQYINNGYEVVTF